MQPRNNTVINVNEEIQKIYDRAVDIGRAESGKVVYHVEGYDQDRLFALEHIQRFARQLNNINPVVAVMEGEDEMKAINRYLDTVQSQWIDNEKRKINVK